MRLLRTELLKIPLRVGLFILVFLVFVVFYALQFQNSTLSLLPELLSVSNATSEKTEVLLDIPVALNYDFPALRTDVNINAFALICYIIHARPPQCSLPWLQKWSQSDQECVEKDFFQVVERLKLSPKEFEHWLIQNCEKSPQSWWNYISPGALKKTIKENSCRHEFGEQRPIKVWLSVIVRRDYGSMPYWLLWHLLLGIDHIILYDNNNWDNELDRIDSFRLNEAISPFVIEKFVTVVRFPGFKQQEAAYNDALRIARNSGVDFVGFLDADEFFVPFAEKCIVPVLSRCKYEVEKCAQVLFNWRMSDPTEVKFNHNKSMWENLKFGLGHPNQHVKTFVNVKSGFQFAVAGSDVHHAAGHNLPFHSFRDNLSQAEESPFQKPEVYPNQVAIVYHAHHTSLLKYISKKSIRGRADVKFENEDDFKRHCPTCFGSLREIIASFPLDAIFDVPKKPETEQEKSIHRFLIERDKLLTNLLENFTTTASPLVDIINL